MICKANQWIGFYMTGASVMKELKANQAIELLLELFSFYCAYKSTCLDY